MNQGKTQPMKDPVRGGKDKLKIRIKYLQTAYLTKNCYPKYINNS